MRKTIAWVTTLVLALGVSGSSALAAEPVDPEDPLNRHAVWMKWFRGDRDVIDERQYADTLEKAGPAEDKEQQSAKETGEMDEGESA